MDIVACDETTDVSQCYMTRRPLPETKITCHARKGCSVNTRVRAVLGISAVAAKSVKASQNDAFAACTAIV